MHLFISGIANSLLPFRGWGLSYDIIKSHGSEIKVETKEGQYAEFNPKYSLV